MNTQEIDRLFRDTKEAFDKSPIKAYADRCGLKWNYSISATRLTEGANLIVGFNWGSENNPEYEQQANLPTENFGELYQKKWLGSLSRIYEPLKRWLPGEDIDNCVQTNFCFFRSKKEEEITAEDLKLSTPLFYQLLNIIKPKRIIGFSKKLQKHFTENELCHSVEETDIVSNRRTLHVAKGLLKDQNISIYFLPHANAKFTGIARESAWRFCFEKG